MNFEKPNQSENKIEGKRTDDEALLLRNKMEVQLCARRFGFEDVETVLPQWIDQFGKAFGVLIEEQPELLDEYENDSDSAIEKVIELLYVNDVVES